MANKKGGNAAGTGDFSKKQLNEFQRLRELIEKLNKFNVQKYVSLPQITVMGDTSSGKSSVLSALSGIEFPSSGQLTTKCPTQLILRQGEKFQGKAWLQRFNDGKIEWEREINSLKAVSNVICEYTEKLVAEGQHISDDSIVIDACSPDFPNLTLTDLPGLIRTVEDGEDSGIKDRVRALVQRYLQQSRTIILAVAPANVDIHNSEILEEATKADPEGDRTICVITKPDLVDKGSEFQVLKLLRNETKKLKLGYHCVKCRGQQDLNDEVSISRGINNEEIFFKSNEPWNSASKTQVGTFNLCQRLTRLMESRIRQCMPHVIEEIRKQKYNANTELLSLGDSFTDIGSKRTHFLQTVYEIDELTKASIKGMYHHNFFENIKHRLRATLRQKDTEFNNEVNEMNKVPTKGKLEVGDVVEVFNNGTWKETKVVNVPYRLLNKDGIRHPLNWLMKSIAECRGEEIAIFPSYSIFQKLAADAVSEWITPLEKLLSSYYNETIFVMESVVSEICTFSPEYHAFFLNNVKSFINEIFEKAKAEVDELIEIEMKPATMNADFISELTRLRNKSMEDQFSSLKVAKDGRDMIPYDALMNVLKNKANYYQQKSNEETEAHEIQLAIIAYIGVAKKRFIDLAISFLDFHFLKAVMNGLRQKIAVISDTQLDSLLAEDPIVTEKREELIKKIATLKEALKF